MKKLLSAGLVMLLGAGIFLQTGVYAAENFTATDAEEESYWYSRYNLGNLVMRSGMGEAMMPDMEMVMMTLQKVDADFDKEKFMAGKETYGDGDHPRPPTNPFLVQSIYKSGDPHYIQTMDPNDFGTQRWDPAKMDKTLTPEALGYTLQKEVEWAKDFHGEEHFGKITDNWGAYRRFVGMALTMEAKMQTKYFKEHMDEFHKNKSVYGHFVLLGAISDLAGIMNDDTFEANSTNRYQDKEAGKTFLALSNMMFDKGFEEGMIPTTIKEYGAAIRSLVRYAASRENTKYQAKALKEIVKFAKALKSMQGADAGEEAYRILGLIEAWRTTGIFEETTKTSAQAFLDNFDTERNIFKGKTIYTIDEVGTIIGALNAIKLFVVDDIKQAETVFKDFFEEVVNKSGLIQSAPPLMIAKSPWEYEGEPESYFRYDGVTLPPMAGGEFGIAPVFATEVSLLQNGIWTVTDGRFDSAGAMHAANEMIWLHYDELNGFPELHEIDVYDLKTLKKIYSFADIYIAAHPAKAKKLPAKIDTLFEHIAYKPRFVKIFKALKKYIETHL